MLQHHFLSPVARRCARLQFKIVERPGRRCCSEFRGKGLFLLFKVSDNAQSTVFITILQIVAANAIIGGYVYIAWKESVRDELAGGDADLPPSSEDNKRK